MISEIDVSGLVGIRWCEPSEMKDPLVACDCWAHSRMVLARIGVDLPADPAEAIARQESLAVPATDLPRAGDVLVIKSDLDPGPHIGVMVNAFSFIHQTKAGSRIDRLDVWERLKWVVGRSRMRALLGASA